MPWSLDTATAFIYLFTVLEAKKFRPSSACHHNNFIDNAGAYMYNVVIAQLVMFLRPLCFGSGTCAGVDSSQVRAAVHGVSSSPVSER